MEQKLPDPLPSLLKARLAGAIFALTVLIPAMYLPGFLDRSHHGFSWIALPALGTVLCTQLVADKRNRLWAGLFGFAGGGCSYLAASSWAAGSPHTSRLEIMLVILLGGIPVLLLYKFWKKLLDPVADQAATLAAKTFWKNRLKAQIKYPRFLFIILFASFTAVTILTILDLNHLEKHDISPDILIRVAHSWAPPISIYDRYGYWPAALFTPCLGLALIGWCAWLNRLKSRNY